MAKLPTKKLAKEVKAASALEIATKKADQEAEGKDFVHDEDGHFAGVIPEEVWKGLKRG